VAGLLRKKSKGANKIIIDNHQGIGDVVHMLPLIENIRATYSKAYITMIVKFADEQILLAPGLVNEFILWEEIDSKKIRTLRARHYDIAYLNVITNYFKGILYLKFVINADKVVSEFLVSRDYKHYKLIKRDSCLHRVIRNNQLSKVSSLLGLSTTPNLQKALSNVLNNHYIKHVCSTLKSDKIIGVCMGSAPTDAKKGFSKVQKDVKQWPLENVLVLCAKLANAGCDVVVLGGAAQKYISDGLAELKARESSMNSPNQMRGYIHDYIGNCSLAESMQLISLCSICVGVDTGLMHMAAALGIPTVTLFGPTNPMEFAPYSNENFNITLNLPCQYCYRKTAMYDCKSNECMKGISVGKVYDIIMERLKD